MSNYLEQVRTTVERLAVIKQLTLNDSRIEQEDGQEYLYITFNPEILGMNQIEFLNRVERVSTSFDCEIQNIECETFEDNIECQINIVSNN